MFKKILIVCIGNICRSAIAERLLSHKLAASLPGVSVRSAGLAAVIGQPADETAADVANHHGISAEGHVARQFTAELGRRSDLILVMEPAHKARIVSIAPELTGKIMLFDYWIGASGIPDPFRQSRDFHEEIYLKLDAAAASWAEKLAAGYRERDGN